jgi:hypothetical protein
MKVTLNDVRNTRALPKNPLTALRSLVALAISWPWCNGRGTTSGVFADGRKAEL